MDLFFLIMNSLLTILLGFNFMYPFILKLMAKREGFRLQTKSPHETTPEPDYAIIVSFYEDIDQLPGIIDSIDRLDYSNFIVYVVADGCDISGIECINPNILLLRPDDVLGNNVRSHMYAIRHFKRPHQRITIIDGDNLIDRNYLRELNKMFDKGYSAVQGARNAKNLETDIANLDAVNDLYYRYVDRILLSKAGSSATLSGSGMAFLADIYRNCLANYKAEGAGFDKILQYEIVRRKIRIGFTNSAIVLDQKTSAPDQLVRQRARWISAWMKSLVLGFKLFLQAISSADRNGFLFSITMLRPPLFILFSFSLLSIGLNQLFTPYLNVAWVIFLLSFFIMFFSALRTQHAPKSMYQSLISIPKFVFFQFLALMKSKRANEFSVATRHAVLHPTTPLKKLSDVS